MQRIIAPIILFAFLLFLSSYAVFADSIELSNGSYFEGRIIEETEETIVMEMEVGSVTFKKDEIEEISEKELNQFQKLDFLFPSPNEAILMAYVDIKNNFFRYVSSYLKSAGDHPTCKSLSNYYKKTKNIQRKQAKKMITTL